MKITVEEYKKLVAGEMRTQDLGWREDRDGQICIVIPGPPVPKPRQTRADKWKKRPCVLRYRDWCDRARAAAGKLPPATEIDHICLWAYFEPKGRNADRKATGTRHRQRPDSDNLMKALDGLFSEDAGLADIEVHKRWDARARVEITITLSPKC